MKKNIKTEAVSQFYRAVLALKDEKECALFFEDLCTANELLSLSQRLEVGVRLIDGQTYQEISKATGASTATISRVNRLLSDDEDGIEMAAGRIKCTCSN